VFKQLGLIGCGLMGSSLALALRRAGLVELQPLAGHHRAGPENGRD
jgi:prephenate dehydrogenase